MILNQDDLPVENNTRTLTLHILNKKLAVSALRHLDNRSQLKEKGKLKFRALVKVNKFLQNNFYSEQTGFSLSVSLSY